MSLPRTLLLLLLLLSMESCNAARSRRKKRSSSSSSSSSSRISSSSSSSNPDDFFPEHLRSGFEACSKEQQGVDDGERGVCKLLAALDSQSALLKNYQPSGVKLNKSSCKFQDEGGDSLHKYASEGSAHLKNLLEKYSQMHQRCTSAEWNQLRNKYENEKGTHLQCRYIVWSCSFGLGNKIMSLVSTFLYALLSQRVLLIDEGQSLDKLFCDAFPASQWHAPSGFSLKDDPSPAFENYLKCYQKNPSKLSEQSNLAMQCAQSGVVPIVFSADTKPEEHEFLFDPAAMASVKNIPILNFRNSNQHFGVGFFLNPVLRPILETIFPDRRVFHNLARFLLKPGDEVWNKISSVRNRHFSPAIRTIGVQLRESKGEYRDFYDMAVPRCIRKNGGMCPIDIDEFLESKATKNTRNPKMDGDYISVYVSSLIGGHARNLTASLAAMEAETGQRFQVAAGGADGEQMDDLEHQQGALADIWALSLADVLLTSHMSTFGYTAQGLAGITPLLLKPWPSDPCWWSLSSDPCFHFAPSAFTSGRNSRPAYVQTCPDLPVTGLQLVES